MTTTWAQVTRYFQAQAANTNDAPRIKTGPHAGRADLNALRTAQPR